MAIDLFDLSAREVRERFPEIYQHLLATVKPERDRNNRASYRENWWLFGEPRRELRPALAGLTRYIATVETAKHRIFQFVAAEILPDNMLVAIAIDDAFHLGVLSSKIHGVWALRAGGWLGVGNDPRYSKSRCFDPFPFPQADKLQAGRIRAIAEDIDEHRKTVLAAHGHLTMTKLYNGLERWRAGVGENALTEVERVVRQDGLVLILAELHDALDDAVLTAYGWPRDLSEAELLDRLVALNRQRLDEERRGHIRWLRPAYQVERFGSLAEKAAQMEADLVLPEVGPKATNKPIRINFPAGAFEQTAVVVDALYALREAASAAEISATFRQGRRIEPKVRAVLGALFRMGLINSTDGGRSFLPRRVA